MSRFSIQTLETSFRGYPKRDPCSWALHYNITFASLTNDLPMFFAEQLSDVKGFFQLPQDTATSGLWGQFDRVDVGSDIEINRGARKAWRTHAQVTVPKDQFDDAWARVKLVYTFRRLASPAWFTTDVAFRCIGLENLERRWGKAYWRKPFQHASFCYSGNPSAYSMEIGYRSSDGGLALMVL